MAIAESSEKGHKISAGLTERVVFNPRNHMMRLCTSCQVLLNKLSELEIMYKPTSVWGLVIFIHSQRGEILRETPGTEMAEEMVRT